MAAIRTCLAVTMMAATPRVRAPGRLGDSGLLGLQLRRPAATIAMIPAARSVPTSLSVNCPAAASYSLSVEFGGSDSYNTRTTLGSLHYNDVSTAASFTFTSCPSSDFGNNGHYAAKLVGATVKDGAGMPISNVQLTPRSTVAVNSSFAYAAGSRSGSAVYTMVWSRIRLSHRPAPTRGDLRLRAVPARARPGVPATIVERRLADDALAHNRQRRCTDGRLRPGRCVPVPLGGPEPSCAASRIYRPTGRSGRLRQCQHRPLAQSLQAYVGHVRNSPEPQRVEASAFTCRRQRHSSFPPII